MVMSFISLVLFLLLRVSPAWAIIRRSTSGARRTPGCRARRMWVVVAQDLVLLSVDHSRASAARDSASRAGGWRHFLMDRRQ